MKNGIEFIVQNHVPYRRPLPSNNQSGIGGAVATRYEQAKKAAKLIAQAERPMTRTELMAAMGLGRTTVRKVCHAGEEMGILKQAPIAVSEAGVLTYLVDVA